jgi:oxygen-dependent protoporphyrinogen oxidase
MGFTCLATTADMDTMTGQRKITIIGAGLSGLATGWKLAHDGADVTIIERSESTGGVIRSERVDGFLCEAAPNSMLVKSRTAEAFLYDLGLRDEIVDSNPVADKRFLVKKGRVLPLPMSLMGGVKTPLYSLRAKFRLLAEPFIRKSGLQDESVASFVTRRMGREFLDYGIASLVSGIYAGDPEKLSIRYAFPKVWNLEDSHGSLIGGAIKLGRERKKTGEIPYKNRMIAFRDGIQTLTRRLTDTSQARIVTGAQITAIERVDDRWTVRWRCAQGDKEISSNALIASVGEPELHNLPWPKEIADRIAAVPRLVYPPVTTLVLGFRREQVAHALDGFGMLVPLRESRRILGAIFSSTIFPDRAPDGHVSLMIFMGGATMPEAAKSSLDEAVSLACGELADLLGVNGEPVFARSVYWPRAIPQYNVGHGDFVAALESIERDLSGLAFCANYRGGPGLSDCLDSALRTASGILDTVGA